MRFIKPKCPLFSFLLPSSISITPSIESVFHPSQTSPDSGIQPPKSGWWVLAGHLSYGAVCVSLSAPPRSLRSSRIPRWRATRRWLLQSSSSCEHIIQICKAHDQEKHTLPFFVKQFGNIGQAAKEVNQNVHMLLF